MKCYNNVALTKHHLKPLDPKAGFARYATAYDDLEKYWDSFEHGKLDPYIRATAGKHVLDAGAGTGRLSVKLLKAGAQVTALDISPEMLAKLKYKKPEIEAVEGDVRDMPFPDESFDMVFSTLTMVHLKKIESFLEECYRVLKNDGLLVLVNIHYRKPMVLSDSRGKYIIECYNHFPRHAREAAEKLAFGVEKEELLKEGDDVWVSQILILKK